MLVLQSPEHTEVKGDRQHCGPHEDVPVSSHPLLVLACSIPYLFLFLFLLLSISLRAFSSEQRGATALRR